MVKRIDENDFERKKEELLEKMLSASVGDGDMIVFMKMGVEGQHVHIAGNCSERTILATIGCLENVKMQLLSMLKRQEDDENGME